MIVDVALGILLALFLLALGIAALALIIKSLPEIFAFVACVGSLLLLIHLFSGWGVALWFVLIVGVIAFADRKTIFNRAAATSVVTHDD